MKNKKITFILVAVVLVVWGIVLVRVFASLSSSPPSAIVEYKPIKKMSTIEIDTFKLLLNYPDPFSGQLARENKHSQKEKTVLKARLRSMTPLDSIMKYIGVIKNEKQTVVLLQINKRQCRVKEGDWIDNICILKSRPDSLQVKYADKLRWIKRRKI
jgi:Tfp pilus assembly protein PilP